MRIRTIFQNNGPAVTLIAIVVLLISMAMLFRSLRGAGAPPPPRQVWYWDASAAQYTAGPETGVDAVLSADGSPRLRAFVYACGSCDKRAEWAGYLSRLDDATVEQIKSMHAAGKGADEIRSFVESREDERLIRSLSDREWVSVQSDAGIAILTELNSKCSDLPLVECLP